ncbi:hypothetical protein R83H12_02303 [Fibrobacteria bacterium R8-3-H12]
MTVATIPKSIKPSQSEIEIFKKEFSIFIP